MGPFQACTARGIARRKVGLDTGSESKFIFSPLDISGENCGWYLFAPSLLNTLFSLGLKL